MKLHNTGNTREMGKMDSLRYPPAPFSKKVVLFDRLHTMSTKGQKRTYQTLLKSASFKISQVVQYRVI